jgi:hypothetical protein
VLSCSECPVAHSCRSCTRRPRRHARLSQRPPNCGLNFELAARLRRDIQPHPECSVRAFAAKLEAEILTGMSRCAKPQRHIPRKTPLLTCRPNTEDSDAAIVRPGAETNGRRREAVPLRLLLLAGCCIREAAILRDPITNPAIGEDRREILFHYGRDRGPGATLHRRMSGGNGRDKALAETCRAFQTSAPRNIRFARATRRVWASASTSDRTILRPAGVRR